jgi:predicted DNA-binding protein (MmcQ/YjbR family)
MVEIQAFRNMALSLRDTIELPHFHLKSFRVKNRIFATLWERENRAMLKLSPLTQSVFCAYDRAVFFPVPGKWGENGATFVDLQKVRKDMFKDALKSAYQETIDKLEAKRKRK